MDLSGKKFGMLLSTGPENATNLDAAVGLSQAALARGANLYLYLIDDGVRALDDARVRALPERGAKLFVLYAFPTAGLLPRMKSARIPGLMVSRSPTFHESCANADVRLLVADTS